MELRAISIRDGVIGWRDKSGAIVTAALPEFRARASGPQAGRMVASGLAIISDVPLRIAAQAGPESAGKAGAAWPASVTLAALGATLRVAATLPGPYRLAGGHVDVSATAPDLAALAPLAALPPLRDVRAQAQLALDGTGRATLTALRVRAGPSDLSAILPGLRLRQPRRGCALRDRPGRVGGTRQPRPHVAGGAGQRRTIAGPAAGRAFARDRRFCGVGRSRRSWRSRAVLRHPAI